MNVWCFQESIEVGDEFIRMRPRRFKFDEQDRFEEPKVVDKVIVSSDEEDDEQNDPNDGNARG